MSNAICLMENTGRSKRDTVLLLMLSVAGIALNFSLTVPIRTGPNTQRNLDFDVFYAAGKLAGSGRLYDAGAVSVLQRQHKARNVLPFFGRLPFFALAFRPLSALPYAWADTLWLAIGLLALAGFTILWPLSNHPRAMTLVCWSFPAAMCLAFGQDTALFLFFATLGLWLLLREQQFAAGIVLSLCVAKPHLALLLPLWLAANRKWKAIGGGVAGGAAILLISFAIEGANWPRRFAASLPQLAAADERMPNLRGIVSLVGGGLAPELALAAVTAAAFWYLSRRLDLVRGAALALAGGLLLSHHAYDYDALLLLPALLLYEADGREWLRAWSLLLFTPVPYLLILLDTTWPGLLLVTGFTLSLFAAEVYRLTQFGTGHHVR